MKLFNKIKKYFQSKFNHYGNEPTWYDINEKPQDMTIEDIVKYKRESNMVFFDSKAKNKQAGFKTNNS